MKNYLKIKKRNKNSLEKKINFLFELKIYKYKKQTKIKKMGNYEETKINEEELKPYLKEGLTMSDLINLKKHLFH